MEGITFMLNSAHWKDETACMPVATKTLPLLPPRLLPNASTLEEVEQELLSSPTRRDSQHKVLYLEEVEEDLLNDPKNKSFHFGYPISNRPAFQYLGEWEDIPGEWMFNSSLPDEEKFYEMEYSFGEQNGEHFTSGFMTEKEKQWLIDIQLMVVETDDPYCDDYYFTVYNERKLGSKRRKRTCSLSSCSKVKHEVKEYQPAQVKGALGWLQIVSVNNPRKALERSVSRSPEEKKIYSSDKYRLEFYHLLRDIEDMLLLLLKSEEELRMDLQEDEVEKCLNSILKQVVNTLNYKERLAQIMSIPKGCRLIMRILNMLSSSKKVYLLKKILSILNTILSKDGINDILMDYVNTVKEIVAILPSEELVNMIESIENFPKRDDILCECQEKTPLVPLLAVKFGCTVLCFLLQQGVKLRDEESVFPLEDGWNYIATCIATNLQAIPEDVVANSKFPFSDILSCVQRFPGGKEILQKLKCDTYSESDTEAEK